MIQATSSPSVAVGELRAGNDVGNRLAHHQAFEIH